MFHEALKYHRMALRIYEKIEDKHGQATALRDISYVLIDMKRFNKAQKNLERSMEIVRAKKIKDESLIASILLATSAILSEYRKHTQAVSVAKSALKMSRRIGEKELEIHVLLQLSQIYTKQKKDEPSLFYARKGFSLAIKLKNKHMIALTSGQIGILYEKSGRSDKARRFISLSRNQAKKIGDKELVTGMKQYHEWTVLTWILLISSRIAKSLRFRLNALAKLHSL